MNAPELILEEDAAERLHVCTRTLRKARQSGQLQWVKLGRNICYTPEDLARFIDEQRQSAPQRRPRAGSPANPRKQGRVVPFSQRG